MGICIWALSRQGGLQPSIGGPTPQRAADARWVGNPARSARKSLDIRIAPRDYRRSIRGSPSPRTPSPASWGTAVTR